MTRYSFLILMLCIISNCKGKISKEMNRMDEHSKKTQQAESIEKYNYELQALNNKEIGQVLNFEISKSPIHKVKVKYLGQIQNQQNGIFPIFSVLAVEHYTGILEDGLRGNGKLVFYSDSTRRIGFYPLGGVGRMPLSIKENKYLVFPSTKKCPDEILVSFEEGLLEEFFLECTNDMGDLYKFVLLE